MKIHYRITLQDGTIAEDSFSEDPIDMSDEENAALFPEEITNMLKHLDQNMEYDHQLSPENGWGDRDPENIFKLPIDDFKKYEDLQEGMILNFDLPNGDCVPGAILEINEGQVNVDFNHPFAGQTLSFHFKRIA